MTPFPMMLCLDGRRVVICATGPEAARLARQLLPGGARIVILGPAPEPGLEDAVADGRVRHQPRLRPDTFEGAALALIATGMPETDAALVRAAQAAGALVHVADPALADDAGRAAMVLQFPPARPVPAKGPRPAAGP
ncbi:NAD(P)-dependent oxidoreductase, partial [Mangrovicoccus algicola]|nr:uroporphyrinogen-III C-methyltransferase [Mangrovicoccus algicola]